MKSWLAAMLTLAAVSASAQQRTRLQVYSTLEVANIADFKKAFEAENRDIEIVWIRDSTGVVTARILAEQGAQRGDAIWGLAVTSTMPVPYLQKCASICEAMRRILRPMISGPPPGVRSFPPAPTRSPS